MPRDGHGSTLLDRVVVRCLTEGAHLEHRTVAAVFRGLASELYSSAGVAFSSEQEAVGENLQAFAKLLVEASRQ